jgi:hypothetical protein
MTFEDFFGRRSYEKRTVARTGSFGLFGWPSRASDEA